MTRKVSESREDASEGTKKVVVGVEGLIGGSYWRITADANAFALEKKVRGGKHWKPIAWYQSLHRTVESLPQLAPRHGTTPYLRDLKRAMHEALRISGEIKEALTVRL